MIVSNEAHGFEAWRLLNKLGAGGGPIPKTGLLTSILEFDFSGDFQDRVKQYLLWVREYEQVLGPGKKKGWVMTYKLLL